MGSALDRLIASHSATLPPVGPGPGTASSGPSALDTLIAAHQARQGASAPSAGRQALSGLEQVGQFFRHPIDAIEGVVKGAGQSIKDAVSPVAGTSNVTPGATRFGDEAAIEASRHPHTYQTGEPGVVSPDVQRRGLVNTAANVGFLAAPELALPARVAVNAGLGAMNDPEQRIRGAVAGTVLGEVLHTPQAIRHVTDFGDGMVEAGVKGMQEQVGEQSKLWNDGRRPAKTLPPDQQPAVEPKPDAATMSAGGEEMSALDKLIAGYTYRAARGGLPENPDVVRRPRESIPMPERSPVEPAPDAATQTFGGNVKRRPGGVKLTESAEIAPPKPADVLQLNGQQDESTPVPRRATALAQPVSYGPKGPIDDTKPELTPLVSSNGNFDARPGVIASVNRAIDQNGRIAVVRPGERVFPADTKTVRDVIGTPESPTFRVVPPEERAASSTPQTPAPASAPTPRAKGVLYDDARTDGGRLRPFTSVTDEALIREMTDLANRKIPDAQSRAQYTWVPDENFHMTEDGRPVAMADRRGGGASRQAKALQNLSDYQRILDGITDELKRRGHTDESIGEHMARQSQLDEAMEREAIAHQDDQGDDSFFGFGEEPAHAPTATAAPAAEVAPDAAATPQPRPSDILNVAKLNLSDQTAEQRVAQQLEQYRAMRDENKQTFAEADVNRAAIVKELTASDPKALAPAAAQRLSGEELLARRDVVRQNDQMIADLSKAIESKTLPLAEHEQAVELLNKAVQHNDALLSDLVLGSSQKGRDLNLLRRMANRSLDPDVWQVQAKRMLGDRPLTDEMSATIRRLSQAAIDACGGAS